LTQRRHCAASWRGKLAATTTNCTTTEPPHRCRPGAPPASTAACAGAETSGWPALRFARNCPSHLRPANAFRRMQGSRGLSPGRCSEDEHYTTRFQWTASRTPGCHLHASRGMRNVMSDRAKAPGESSAGKRSGRRNLSPVSAVPDPRGVRSQESNGPI
jgi:hypothetical protein